MQNLAQSVHAEKCLVFAFGRDNATVLPGSSPNPYICNETTHHWREDLIWKVAGYKDKFIQMTRDGGFDFIFLVDSGEVLEDDEIDRRQAQFLKILKQPGTYRVGGLGAYTLISRRAISLGVSFREIYNLDMIGEDRHFCVRAAALGLDLHADTHYPPCHIYRESKLAGIKAYKEQHFPTGETGTPSGSGQWASPNFRKAPRGKMPGK